jgi:ABC-2 type transport system ATP-binding protein
VLLTTQYLGEADALADQVVTIDRGRVVADRTPEQLEKQAGPDVVVLRTASDADLDGLQRVVARAGGEAVIDRDALTPTRSSTAAAEQVASLLAQASSAGTRLAEVKVRDRRDCRAVRHGPAPLGRSTPG